MTKSNYKTFQMKTTSSRRIEDDLKYQKLIRPNNVIEMFQMKTTSNEIEEDSQSLANFTIKLLKTKLNILLQYNCLNLDEHSSFQLVYNCFKITHFRRKSWVLTSVLPGSLNFCAALYTGPHSLHLNIN